MDIIKHDLTKVVTKKAAEMGAVYRRVLHTAVMEDVGERARVDLSWSQYGSN